MWILYFIPKKLLSHFVGWLVYIKPPAAINKLVLRWFAKRYRVNLAESERDLYSYNCLGNFFSRNLKEKARVISNGIVSPVDGRVVIKGDIEIDSLLQVKGKKYSLERLIGNKEIAASFYNGKYITIYLSPGDYHHIHSPLSGEIIESIYIPGALWPVNNWSVSNIDNLFCVNERITSVIETESHGKIAVVMVGATNVGCIELEYDKQVSTYALRKEGFLSKTYQSKIEIKKGERLGSFKMGSTVILLFENAKVDFSPNCTLDKIKLGEIIAE